MGISKELVVLVLQVDKTMNKEQLVVASNSFPTLVQLAGVEVFNIVFNTYFIISEKKIYYVIVIIIMISVQYVELACFLLASLKAKVGEIESI